MSGAQKSPEGAPSGLPNLGWYDPEPAHAPYPDLPEDPYWWSARF